MKIKLEDIGQNVGGPIVTLEPENEGDRTILRTLYQIEPLAFRWTTESQEIGFLEEAEEELSE